MGRDKVPALGEKTNYDDWKKRVKWWQKATDTKPENQAATLIMHMSGKPEEIAIQLDVDGISVQNGVQLLLTELDKLYEKDATQSIFTAIDSFLSYRRPSETSMDEYVREFNQRYKSLVQRRNKGDELFEDGILAYFLLHQASLTEEQMILIRATVNDLSYKNMEASLKRTYGEDPKRCASACTSLSTKPNISSNSGGYNFQPVKSPICKAENVIVKEEPTFFNQHGGEEYYYDDGYGNEMEQHELQQNNNFALNDQQMDADVFYQYQQGKQPNFKHRGYRQSRPSFRAGGSAFSQHQQSNGQPRRFPAPNVYARGGQNNKGINCFLCGQKGHKARECQFNSFKGDSHANAAGFQNKINFFESDFVLDDNDDSLIYLMGETVNKALLDTGASSTVCGKKWLNVFEESLTPQERDEIQTIPCEKSFRFGDGDSVVANLKKRLPISMCGQEITLDVHVVDNDVPLLLSRETMKNMKMKIDNEHDKIYALGGESDLIITKTGHMVIPIARCDEKPNISNTSNLELEQFTYFVDVNNSAKCAEHLHKYFAHGSSSKIEKFIKTMELENEKDIIVALHDFQKNCDFCKRHKSKETPHRKVAIPQGDKFNDLLAMDLKKLNCGIWIVHFIDTVTRYASAAPINSKGADEIMTKLFERWISVFGRPLTIMSDNGGEFVNESFTEMCAVMNINFKTSPSESPWCNGTVERHNGLLANMIDAVLEDTKCNVDIATAWAVNAKNSLCNVYGFCPQQLALGRNPRINGILEYDNLPALNEETCSKLLSDNLNAMSAARLAFIKMENCERLRRIMRERVHANANERYYSGDLVYYKRRNQKGPWLGPATVVGQIENQVLLKHGGSLIRIHPCKIVLKSEADKQVNNPTTTSTGQHHHEDPANVQYQHRQCSDQRLNSKPYGGDSESEDDDSTKSKPWVSHSSSKQETMNQIADISSPADVDANDISTIESGMHELEDQQPVSNSNGNLLWKKVQQSLKADDRIRYREQNSEGWTTAAVINRAGKANGKYKNMYNVKPDGNETAIQITTDELDVEKLTDVPAEQNIHFTGGTLQQDTKLLFMHQNDEVIFHGTSFPDEIKVQKAKEAELKKFQEYNVYQEVKNIGQSTISCRWVITKKGEAVKARLVARGFEEMLVGNVDAPTVNSTSLWTLFTICASNKWNVESFDISSAFLQADGLERNVFINPPTDARKSGIIWKLNKPMYGLGDSSRKWYFTLKNHLITMGCEISQLDKTVFRFYDNNKLSGILVTHVDDVLYAGNTKFQQTVVRSVINTFKISRQFIGAFIYLGLSVCQNKESGEIIVDQNEYAKSITPVLLSPSRKKALESALNEDEKASYQSTLGKLLWLSGRTRPDISYDTMELSTFSKDPKVKDILTLNKVVKKVSDGDSRLCFKPMNLKTDTLKIVFYSDAGLGNLPNGNSSRGYVIFIANQNGTTNILSWSSNKIKRVVHSAFAAETLGCNDAVSDSIYTRQLICETLYNDSRAKVIPVYGYVDNMQLFEQITSTKQASDKRIRLDMAEIQQSVQNQDIENILWAPTNEMLADCLTKRNADSSKLKLVLETGYCNAIASLQ